MDEKIDVSKKNELSENNRDFNICREIFVKVIIARQDNKEIKINVILMGRDKVFDNVQSRRVINMIIIIKKLFTTHLNLVEFHTKII